MLTLITSRQRRLNIGASPRIRKCQHLYVDEYYEPTSNSGLHLIFDFLKYKERTSELLEKPGIW